MFQRFAEEQGSFVGRSIEDLAATCLLLALKKNGSVTGSGEFAAATGGVQKTGLKTRRTVTKILGEPLEPPGLKTQVSRVGKALGLKPSLIEEAEKMVEKTGIKKSNRALSTKVAAALYLTLNKQGLAGKESQFLRRVGEKVSVNPKSVKRAIREMNET